MKCKSTLVPVGMVVLFPSLCSAAAKITPARTRGELVLFDAAAHGTDVISNGSWPGEDLTPVSRLVRKGGKKYVEFSYKGKRGKARSVLYYETVPEPEAGTRYAGIRLTIDYARDDFSKLGVTARFADATQLDKVLTLEPGERAYTVAHGYRRAKFPPKWEKLIWLRFNVRAEGDRGSALRFRLRKIVMLEEERKEQAKELEVARARKTHEVLPLKGPVTIDGDLKERTWAASAGLTSFSRFRGGEIDAEDSPLAVKIAYDDRAVYLGTRSEFPTPPLAQVAIPDMDVYHDEAQEYFFSGENDNHSMIQFVVNAKAVVFDAVRRDVGKSVRHRKALRYGNGVWTTEIAFPLEALNVDLTRQRYAGFQIAQSYLNRKEKRLRTVVWEPTSRFPDPGRFGVLVFNKKTFGPGEVRLTRIRRVDHPDGTADFHLDCAFRGFRAGTYACKYALVGGGGEAEERQLRLAPAREMRETFKVGPARNENGLYTFYLTVLNPANDARVCAVDFVNSVAVPDLFGKRLFSPRPKHVEWKQGEFPARRHSDLFLQTAATARTRKTAEIFRKKYQDHTGIRLTVRRPARTSPRRGIVLRLARSVTFKGKPQKSRKEGYHLQVDTDRVVITGFDEPGLYYGMITFFQLMKNSMRIREQMPVPCVEVLDWPDLPNRMMILSSGFGSPFRWTKLGEKRGIDYCIEWADRFVAQNKANILYADLSRNVRHKRRPEFDGRERIYSLDDLKKLGQFCRDNFVDTCPAWQIGGHANWWLFGYHPELREKGYRSQADVTHPDHNKIVFGCMLDYIEALRPKYLSPKSDEWWGPREHKEKIEPLLRGKTRAQAFLDFHVKLNSLLKAKGVRMMMFHDMLTPYANGKKYDLYKIVDRFPKDIIINHWGNQRDVPWFAKKGFTVWVTPNGGFGGIDERYRRQVSGFGNIIYSLGNDLRGGLLDQYMMMGSTYALCRAADYGWNAFAYPGDEPGREVSVRNLFALKPNPRGGEKVEPIDTASQFTHSFGAYLKEVKPDKYAAVDEPVHIETGTRQVGFIPTQLVGGDAKNCIVLRENHEGVSIPVDAGYSSLIFLHTAFINNPQDKRAKGGNGRRWPYGWPCGEYVVQYEDGEEAVLPVRLTMNIRRFDTSSRNRATNDNRYVHVLTDHNYGSIHLYQLEWVNPRPDTRIEKIVARHDNQLDVSLILFAVSGRGVWRP